jgi:type I restriction enzyme R subunit
MSAQPNAKVFLPAAPPPLTARRARRGTRAHAVASMLESVGWKPGAYVRNVPLGRLAGTPGERRQHHHGARDDLVSYVLYARPGVPTAVVATVGAQHDPAKALQRALRQAQRLDVPLAYATNGRDILEHFAASRRTQPTPVFTTPTRAWRAFARYHGLRAQGADLLGQRFDQQALADAGADLPHAEAVALRYYQTVAMNRALTAYSNGAGSAAVQIPAGAGATVTAMAFASKLLTNQLVRRPGEPLGLLYLDDRPQAMTGLGAVGTTARWGGRGEVFAALESVGRDAGRRAGGPVDLVVVNLAHGGAALDPETWTEALDRFPKAFHLGVVGSPPVAGWPIQERFGAAIYRYSRQHAVVDGWLPAGCGAANPELAAPDEADLAADLEAGGLSLP